MKTKIFNLINASMLPALILALTIITDGGSKEILPEPIQSLMIPILPAAFPSNFVFLEIIGIFAIGLVLLNNIRWPAMIAAYLGFGWVAVTAHDMIFSTPLMSHFSLAATTWFGTALICCRRAKLAFIFLPKRFHLPALPLLIIFLGVNGLLSFHIINHYAPGGVQFSWYSTALGIGTGLVCCLTAGLIGLILKAIKLPVGKIVFRTVSKPRQAGEIPSPAKETSSSATEAAPPVSPAPAETPAPSALCKETGKILSNADLREIESIRKKETQAAATLSSEVIDADNENDWLSKHLSILET